MKKALLTIAFVFCSLLFAVVLDYLLFLFMDGVVFRLLNLFNSFSLFIKLLTIFLGGTLVISLLFTLFGFVAQFIRTRVLDKFPENNFIIIFSIILFCVNVILGIKVLWDSFPRFAFWTFLEFLMLVGCVFSINFVFISSTKRGE